MFSAPRCESKFLGSALGARACPASVAVAKLREGPTVLQEVDLELEVPREVPVMTMSGAVLFPQAMMPLRIFEPRYRAMLADVLSENRLFAVAGLDESLAQTDQYEPPYEIAALGIVRACHQNDDGTSQLILQGLSRVRIVRIVRETPYRIIEIEALRTHAGKPAAALARYRRQVTTLLQARQRLGVDISESALTFLKSITDPEAFIDLACYALCADTQLKQRFLEMLEVAERFQVFAAYLARENETTRFERLLRGPLRDDQLELN